MFKVHQYSLSRFLLDCLIRFLISFLLVNIFPVSDSLLTAIRNVEAVEGSTRSPSYFYEGIAQYCLESGEGAEEKQAEKTSQQAEDVETSSSEEEVRKKRG